MIKLNNSGFTLFELIVALGIIIMISAMVLTNFKEGEKRQSLSLKAQTLASSLRGIQNKAQIAKPITGGQIPTSYGAQFIRNNQSYIIFAETGTPDYQYNGGDTLLETVTLGDFSISSLNAGACNLLNVGFAVPSADVYFNGGQVGHSCGGNNPTSIQLTNGLSDFVEVQINWISGQIGNTSIN